MIHSLPAILGQKSFWMAIVLSFCSDWECLGFHDKKSSKAIRGQKSFFFLDNKFSDAIS